MSPYSTLYVRYWGHGGYLNDVYLKNTPKFYPPKWHFFKYLSLNYHIFVKILDHFRLFRGDFGCFIRDFRWFFQNRIFKTKWSPLGPKKWSKYFNAKIVLKPLQYLLKNARNMVPPWSSVIWLMYVSYFVYIVVCLMTNMLWET